MSKTSFFYRSYNIDPNSLIPASAAAPAASSLKSPRLTHCPTANTHSTEHKLKHYPINIALVTRPECPKGVEDEVKRSEGPLAGSRAPRLLVLYIK